MKKLYVIVDSLFSNESDWEWQILPLLQGYIDSMDIQNYEVLQVNSLQEVQSLFQNNAVSKLDTFICTNGWSPMVAYIRHLAEGIKIKPRIVSFWSNGCFNNTDSTFRPLNDRNWRKVYERAHHRCSDKSFFCSEYFKEQFRIYVAKRVFTDRLTVMPFPLDYLLGELAEYRDGYFKTDVILFPWGKETYNTMQEQIIYDVIRVFRDKQVIFAQENGAMPREQILKQIARSKCVFLPYASANIGKEIYECLILGAVPLVPALPGFVEFLPEEFLYPMEWTDTIFNYCIHAPKLIERISDIVNDYGKYVNLISETEQRLTATRFSSVKFMEEIFQ
jgi:hypothetical protein